MQAPILIVTPTAGFGELIQQTLEMAGYRPVLVREAGRALELARKMPFSLAILDADLEGAGLPQLSEALRQMAPGLRLISTPPGEEGEPAPAFTPDAILNKPFYLPDLLEMVEKLAPAGAAAPLPDRESAGLSQGPVHYNEEDESPPPAWLEDQALVARRLARLAPPAAQTAVILRPGGLWAAAGQLPQEAVEELSQAVMQSWSQGAGRQGRRSDVARFVRLRSVEGEFMLYATRLAAGMVLALAFDAEMSFSKIRTQAGALARLLASPPGEEDVPPGFLSADAESRESVPFEAAATDPPFLPPDLVPPPTPGRPIKRSEAPAAPAWERPSQESIVDLDEEVAPAFAAIFDQAPDSSLAVSAPADLQVQPPGSSEEAARSIDLMGSLEYQQLPSGLYLLSYACVLVPRLPQHHLTGSLPVRLADWVQQLSLSFGWRLETLSIRPDYLMWICQVTPNTSPGHVVKVMRRHTSRHIFEEFPLLARDNPSGDFWASGYLAITTSQPPPAQVLKDFVAQTRRRQGVPGAA